jgi:hypothetical protein
MMRKTLLLLAALGIAWGATARQTLEEATDSIRQIYARAQAGNPADQNEVGGWYYRGRHVPQNFQTAAQYWAKAAQSGNALAIGNLALCYQTGNGVNAPDSLRAAGLYLRSIREGNNALFDVQKRAAREGNVFSAALVAQCYADGIGTAKNLDSAIEYYTIAAEKGSVLSQRRLGLALFNRRQNERAFEWFERAADAGDVNSVFMVGRMYLQGRGTARNASRGVDFLLRAAREGHANAMLMLADCYIDGDGVTRNPSQGIDWLRRAAGKGLAKADWQLAKCEMNGTGTPVNYALATYYFSQAIPQNYSGTFTRLITDTIADSPYVKYLRGRKAYSRHDFDQAMELFKEVERTNRAEGQLMQGVILANSNYSRHNLDKGIKLIRKAAESDPQAMYVLASLHEQGRGVDQNMPRTVELYTASANAGYGPAMCALADMYFEGRGVDQDYTLAVKYYTEARDSGQLTPSAAHRLADCYQHGWGGLQPDADEAKALNEADFSSHIDTLMQLI